MKNKYILYSALAGSLLLGLQACQPDDYSMDGKKYANEAAVAFGSTFNVTQDENDPNLIHCTSTITNAQGIWDTPNGTIIGNSCDFLLPFAGEYQIRFGVMENGGITFSEPYTLNLTTNNLAPLTDNLWTNLTGGIGKSKKWVPVDKDYGVGQCTAPAMYLNPDDVQNNGKNAKELKLNNGGKENWSPNWDPGYQDWWIPNKDSKYMQSYMTFSLSEETGAMVECFHGETGETKTGKYNFNISDKTAPVISFMDGTFAMHNTSFNDVCANYTTNIKIIELTPYMLQIATMRTNSEGPWWIVWNFIAEDVQSGEVEIPNDEILDKTPVASPTVADLATSLFTVEGNDGSYQANSVTYFFNEDKTYDLYWWDGSSAKWTERNVYDSDLYPQCDGSAFALTLKYNTKNKKGDQDTVPYYSFEEEDSGLKGIVNFAGNKIIFLSEPDKMGVQLPVTLPFFTTDKGAKASISTSEIIVIKADPTNNEFFFALPNSKDESGVVNEYLYANLIQKSIFSAPDPNVKLNLDPENIKNCMWYEGNTLRIGLWHSWASKGLFAKPTQKIGKGQTLTFKFKLTGIDWKDTPKYSWASNTGFNSELSWSPNKTEDFNFSNEITLSIKNTSDGAVNFSSDCLNLCLEWTSSTVDIKKEGDNVILPETIQLEVISCTIE